jgi:hypothetical protein
MKKIILHSLIYVSVILLAASCSKEVKAPVKKTPAGSATTTTTTGTQTQNQAVTPVAVERPLQLRRWRIVLFVFELQLIYACPWF